MSNDNPGRSPRTTNGSAPMGSAVAVAVTLIAVVLGFVILKKVNDNGDTKTVTPATNSSAPTNPVITDPPITDPPIVTSTTVALVVIGTNLQVANSSNQDGVAKQMSAALGGKGFTMAEPTSGTEKLEKSKVLYNADDPNALAVAESLGAYFRIEVVAAGTPLPTKTGAWAEGSGVLFLLGNDFAGKTLDQIAGIPTTGVTTAPTTPTT